MNKRERFTELVTTIDLMGDVESLTFEDFDSKVRFPNLTTGLDEDMGRALIVHAMSQDEDWRMKLYATLLNSAMEHGITERNVSQEDIMAFAIAGNVAWASREGVSAMKALGTMAITLVTNQELECPHLAYAPFLDPALARGLKDENPYDYLDQ